MHVNCYVHEGRSIETLYESWRFKLEFSLRLKICEARERCEIRALPNERCCQIYTSLSPEIDSSGIDFDTERRNWKHDRIAKL